MANQKSILGLRETWMNKQVISLLFKACHAAPQLPSIIQYEENEIVQNFKVILNLELQCDFLNLFSKPLI